MNLQAGLDLFAATGSLIARPQRIMPVVVIPATVLWVPLSANIDGLVTGVDPGYSQEAYGPQTWRNEVGIAPPLTLAALQRTWADLPESMPDVGPHIPWRSEESRITFHAAPADIMEIQRRMDEYEDRLFASLFGAPRASVPNLGEHTPADDDLVATLLDFARASDLDGFRELAVMRGVPAAEIAPMWDGTVKRLGRLPS